MEKEKLTSVIIGACIDIHRQLGPGLLESAYEACLYHELTTRGLSVQKQVALPVVYKEVNWTPDTELTSWLKIR